MYLVSIDPGLRVCGVAFWRGGTLLRAGLAKSEAPASARDAAAWAGMIDGASKWIARNWTEWDEQEYAIELPQVYDRSRSKGDPNDLIQIAAVVGEMSRFGAGQRTIYRPREWKSTVKKEVMCRRVEGRLSVEERARVELPARSLQHNVWDAVGVGLHHLGRLGGKLPRQDV